MNHAPFFSLSIAACGLLATTLVAQTPSEQPPAQQPSASTAPADDPAAGLFEHMCSDCHDSTRIVARRRTKPEWEDTLHKMIDEGATGSAKDFEAVFAYLLRNHGKVYISSATVDDIITIVGLSKKDAEAIVAYRKANGAFADFEAVKKVPDIDVKKLEEHKDAVAF